MGSVKGGIFLLEKKPYWSDIPIALQQEIAEKLGSRIVRADRVFGGFGPSATFRLYLEDGRTFFAKGAGKGATPYNWEAVAIEEQVYENVVSIRPFAPKYFGSVQTSEWHLLFLEDVSGTIQVPPWNDALAKQVIAGIAAFHVKGQKEQEQVPMFDLRKYGQNWKILKENKNERNLFLALFKEKREEAEAWFDQVIELVIEAEEQVVRSDQPWGLIHLDLRSDNMRIRNEKLVLFDWSCLCQGPLMLDVSFFLPSVVAEGGPSAEVLLHEYRKIMRRNGVTFPEFCIAASAAYVAGFFAARAGKEAVPLLPRLRELQRRVLGPALDWMAICLQLPKPPDIYLDEQ